MDVRQTVSDILAKRIDVSNLKEEDSLKNIGLDSLDLVEVMLEIEDALGIEFDSDEIAGLTTLKSVLDLQRQDCGSYGTGRQREESCSPALHAGC